jgi:Aspartyl protease
MAYHLDFEKLSPFDTRSEGIGLAVEIRYAEASITINATIDTGATFSIFERRFGEQLGLDVESGMRQRFGTATGIFYAYGFRVSLTTAGIELDSMVFFAADDGFMRNVLGRITWLDNLVLGLVHYEGKIYLSKYSSE